MKKSSLLLAVMVTALGHSVQADDKDAIALRNQLQTQLGSLTQGAIVDKSLLPNLSANNWKVQVLAKEEAISRVVEVQGNTVLHVGQEFRSDRIIIHGDGVVWVDGTVLCPHIDIRGRGMVVFTENPLNFNGGWILMNSGLVVSKTDNHAGVHFRKGGSLLVDRDNHGEVIVTEGALSLKVGGHQNGNITLNGASDVSELKIGGDLYGFLNSNQDVNLEMRGSIYSNLLGRKNVNVKAKDFLGEWIKVTSALTAQLESLGVKDADKVEMELGSGKVNVKKSSHANIVVAESLNLTVGEDHYGNLEAQKGSIELMVKGYCEADIKAAQDIKIKANAAKGEMVAGANGNFNIAKTLESYRLETGANAVLVCDSFWGNIKVGQTGNLKAKTMERGDFSHHVEIKKGSIEVESINELDLMIEEKGKIQLGENHGVIKIGGDGEVMIKGSSDKEISLASNGKITVKGDQVGAVYIGGNGEVDLGVLTGDLNVIEKAVVVLGTTETMEYVDGGITIGFGSVEVKRDNIVTVTSTKTGGALSLKVGGQQMGNLTTAGDLNSEIKQALEGAVLVSGSWKHTALSHDGSVDVTGIMEANVRGDWMGHVAVEGKGGGMSKLTAVQIIDSNLIFQCPAEVKAKSMLNQKGADESLRLKGGLVEMSEDLQAHLASTDAVVVKARRIIGDVHVDESSRIDAIIKGRLNN